MAGHTALFTNDRITDANIPKGIGIRNRSMIDKSDLVICYIEHKRGGAFKAIQYAESIGKLIINLI